MKLGRGLVWVGRRFRILSDPVGPFFLCGLVFGVEGAQLESAGHFRGKEDEVFRCSGERRSTEDPLD